MKLIKSLIWLLTVITLLVLSEVCEWIYEKVNAIITHKERSYGNNNRYKAHMEKKIRALQVTR